MAEFEAVEEDKYTSATRERQKHADAVLQHASKKKIVVAGPGTGKTHLFKRILESKQNTLTLTFVTALVEDLSLELAGLSDVRTLHGFARSVLKKATKKDIKVFPKLPQVIREDAAILLSENIDFEKLFHNRQDENERIAFYKKRKDYYGHYYGFSDIILGAAKYFEKYGDKVPQFNQVVVDEFQDFNALEVSLIDLLAKQSPILLAGDDDQALYESLKSASASHIRDRHGNATSGYAPFCLPFCSRCTRVIVEAINDMIASATEQGYLNGRLTKQFRYFDDPTKDTDSDNNSKLIYSQQFARRIPWYIQNAIEQIAKEVRKPFTVLVISPTKMHSRKIVGALRDNGFKNIQFADKSDVPEPTLLDGLKLLLENKNCNLGWRVAVKALLSPTDFETFLKNTHADAANNCSELIHTAQKNNVAHMLKTLRAVRDGKKTDNEELDSLFKAIGLDAYGMARDCLNDELKSGERGDSNPAIRRIHVTATTIQSSKGLAADYVFITHFDDQYFIKDKDKNNVSDQDICNVLVSFTRARTKLFLISSDTKKNASFSEMD